MGGFENGEKHAYVIKVWPLSLIQAKSAKVRSQLYDLQSRVSIIINSEPLMHALSPFKNLVNSLCNLIQNSLTYCGRLVLIIWTEFTNFHPFFLPLDVVE